MTTATRSRKAEKIVQIVARIDFKNDARKVVYKVRPSKGGTPYETTLFCGLSTSCTCPSRKPCYHMEQLEVIEHSRLLRKAEEQLAREQSEAVRAAEAMLLSEREDAEEEEAYQQWKRDNGLDQPLSREAYDMVFDPHGFLL